MCAEPQIRLISLPTSSFRGALLVDYQQIGILRTQNTATCMSLHLSLLTGDDFLFLLMVK